MDEMMNWLWQGGVIAAAASSLLALTRPSARLRYIVWCFALVLVLLLPAAAERSWQLTEAATTEIVGPLPRQDQSTVLLALPEGWWTSDAVAIGVWTGWAAVHAGQLLFALIALGRAKRRCRAATQTIEARLALWSRLRSTGRRTRLMMSSDVPAAAVLGGRSPIVALSPAVVEELTPEEIDVIVAHEWAHVQRRDDLAALAQAVVRVVAGWHPAVWWLDRQISRDREHACDERVLELTGAAKAYATCLVKLAGLPTTPLRALPVVAMSGTGLRRRVVHVLAWRGRGPHPRRWAALATATLLVFLASAVSGIELVESTDSVTVVGGESENLEPSSDVVHVVDASSRPAVMVPANQPPVRVSAAATMAATPSTRPAVARMAAPSAAELAAPEQAAPATRELPGPPAITSVDRGEAADITARPLASIDSSMTPLREGVAPGPIAAAPAGAASAEPTPWSAAADAGVAIGRGSQQAAVATAGFFTRMSRKIASSF